MTHSDAPIIEFKNIGKNYGNISALRGVSLGVRQGEVTCILEIGRASCRERV